MFCFSFLFIWLDCFGWWLVRELSYFKQFPLCLVMLLKYNIMDIFIFPPSSSMFFHSTKIKYIKIKEKLLVMENSLSIMFIIFFLFFLLRCKINFFIILILFLIGFEEAKIKQHKLLEAFHFNCEGKWEEN